MLMRRAPRVPDQQQQPTRLPCLTSQLHAQTPDTRDTELAVAAGGCWLGSLVYQPLIPLGTRWNEWQLARQSEHRSLIWDFSYSATRMTYKR